MSDKSVDETIKVLRKSYRIADLTVVRFKSGIYNYAAIFDGGKWRITGTGARYGTNVFTTKAFLENVLGGASEVYVATDWKAF